MQRSHIDKQEGAANKNSELWAKMGAEFVVNSAASKHLLSAEEIHRPYSVL